MAEQAKAEAILSGKSQLTPEGTVRGGGNRLQCIVVTPESAVLDASADFVALPMFDGELGVLPGRAPLIGRLGYGELRVRIGEHTQHYYLDGGFAQVRANIVTVLTAKAIPSSEISAAAAQQALQEALKPATGEALDFALKQQARARAQLHLAKVGTGETIGHG